MPSLALVEQHAVAIRQFLGPVAHSLASAAGIDGQFSIARHALERLLIGIAGISRWTLGNVRHARPRECGIRRAELCGSGQKQDAKLESHADHSAYPQPAALRASFSTSRKRRPTINSSPVCSVDMTIRNRSGPGWRLERYMSLSQSTAATWL